VIVVVTIHVAKEQVVAMAALHYFAKQQPSLQVLQHTFSLHDLNGVVDKEFVVLSSVKEQNERVKSTMWQ
jgi:hypothetical protein